MTPLPVAHIGHWWGYLLYGVPVVIVLFSVVLSVIRERRDQDPD